METRLHSSRKVRIFLLLLLPVALIMRKFRWITFATLLTASHPLTSQEPTVLHVNDAAIHEHVKKLGINLGGQTFYGSSQIERNLVSRNPGFEGEEWQTLLQCTQVTATSCTDYYPNGRWPAGFLDGGTYEFILGAAKGQTGAIIHSTAPDPVGKSGVTIQFAAGARTPAVSDYLVVRKQRSPTLPGGWATSGSGGGTVSTETTDLSPSTAGTQAVRLSASGSGEGANVGQYFDSAPVQSFVHMRGQYTISFKAKGISGNRKLSIRLLRISPFKPPPLFMKSVTLDGGWRDYSFTFTAEEAPDAFGTASLSFGASGAEVLLDDVSLVATEPNGTAFRTEVVDTLQRLHPGVLRYMDSGQNYGSSIYNMLAVEGARKRTGYSKWAIDTSDMPIGLHDFLVLCEKVGAEPWYSMQMGMSPDEVKALMEYLGGPVTTKYGAKRAALGHPVPWTKVFSTIHLEYGNEAWNVGNQGSAIYDPALYGRRAADVFSMIRSSPWFAAKSFDLILDSQAVNPWRTGKELSSSSGVDSVDIAPYLFSPFNDDSSIESVFGPMFAEPEMMDSTPKGLVRLQADAAANAKPPASLAVYETSIGTEAGSVPQASVDAAIPSVGAGIAAIDHMLLMLRDDGILVQNTFQLTGYRAGFRNSKTHDTKENSPVWGVVVDMGGATNRVRPSFLAQEMANQAIYPTMLATNITGFDPTWDQPPSTNSKVQLAGAHELQPFAFTDGKRDAVIIFNLSRATPRSLTIAGKHAPAGMVTVKTLTSGRITDGNEFAENVKTATREEKDVRAGQTVFVLPPFSMTVFMSGERGHVQ
ncbi:MAG TPA: hypothetical protein VGD64_04895 [Acidisarcina sp.]